MYSPQVDDYVIWHTTPAPLQGWVYFVTAEYITIEISVKDKTDNFGPQHKKTHCCVLCFPEKWHELEYVKNRRHPIDIDQYKSQEGRYLDVQ
jgi:hypothetical protein